MSGRCGGEAGTAVERELAPLAHEHVDRPRGVVIEDTGDGLSTAATSSSLAVDGPSSTRE